MFTISAMRGPMTPPEGWMTAEQWGLSQPRKRTAHAARRLIRMALLPGPVPDWLMLWKGSYLVKNGAPWTRAWGGPRYRGVSREAKADT